MSDVPKLNVLIGRLHAFHATRVDSTEQMEHRQKVLEMFEELERECAELRRDAERYRWLRLALSDRGKSGRSHWICAIPEGKPEELDAAIDAAIVAHAPR
jgi:hypothetical protein